MPPPASIMQLLSILENLGASNVRLTVYTGSVLCNAEYAQPVIEQQLVDLVRSDVLASQFLQSGITCEAKCGFVADDIFGAEIANQSCPVPYIAQDLNVTKISIFETDEIPLKRLFGNCTLISKVSTSYVQMRGELKMVDL